MRRATGIVVFGLALAGVLCASRPARANGRFPASNQIVFSPSNPDWILARTSYGLLPSVDHGASWRFICEDALGLPSTASQDPQLAVTANGTLVAGLYSPVAGLDVSTDMGCNWTCVGGGLNGLPIVDVALRQDAPDVVVALASSFLPADAGGGMRSQIYRSTDDGATWAPVGSPFDPALVLQTIDLAPSSSQTIYVSATRGFGAARTASLLVSNDDGQTFVEQPITEFDAQHEDSVFIGAVDPTDATRVYLRTSATTGPSGGLSRLYVTTDSGQNFVIAQSFDVPAPTSLVASGEILGFALSPDGSKIYTGTVEQGLWMAQRGDMAFTQTAPTLHVQCLAARGSELWACSDEVSGFVVGVSTDDGAHFSESLPTITGLAGPIACPAQQGGPLACQASASASACSSPYQMVCEIEHTAQECTGDGGAAADSGEIGDAGDVGHSARSSGLCAVTRDRDGPGVWLAAFFAVPALLRRRGARR